MMTEGEDFDMLLRRATRLAENDERTMYELVRHRRDSGLTQADVDERLGWEPGRTAEFETYWYDPRLSEIRRYALAVGMGIRHTTFVEVD